jgi:hypothetical protein
MKKYFLMAINMHSIDNNSMNIAMNNLWLNLGGYYRNIEK